jgi:hypothetical protein
MPDTTCHMSISLDGFVAGPDQRCSGCWWDPVDEKGVAGGNPVSTPAPCLHRWSIARCGARVGE